MFRQTLLFIFIIFSLTAFADNKWLINDRERGSFFLEQKKYARKLRKFLDKQNSEELKRSYSELLEQDSFECEDHFLDKLGSFPMPKALHLRSLNLIDDIALKSLLDHIEIKQTETLPVEIERELYEEISNNHNIKDFISTAFSQFKTEKSCKTSFYFNLKNNSQKLLTSQSLDKRLALEDFITILLKLAVLQKEIDLNDLNDLNKINFFYKNNDFYPTWKQYRSKKEYLENRSFNLVRTDFEKSIFVVKEEKKLPLSRRMNLFKRYSGDQIILLAGILKRFQTNIEATSGKIEMMKGDEVIYTRPLNEMELYCTAVNEMQLQMEELKINTFFQAGNFRYEDMITAAYELNVVNADTIEEFLKLEHIWRSKQNLWQKVQKWVSPLGSLAIIFVTPPYNLVLGMMISVGQQLFSKGDQDASRLHNIINCNR